MPGAPPPTPRTCAANGLLRLKLVHQAKLDRNPRAGKPDDHAKTGPVPPELLASGIVPPIVVDDGRVVFVSETGSIAKVIQLNDDRNLSRSVHLSPGGTLVDVGTTFSNVLNDGETAEGGEWPVNHTIYDRSGRAMYTTTAASDDVPHLADDGSLVFQSIQTGQLLFVSKETGRPVRRFSYLGPYGAGRPKVGIAASGRRVVVAADTTSLDGNRDPALMYPDPRAYMARARREVWVSLFDREGRELWRKLLPGADRLQNAVISDDGERVLVGTEVLKSSRLDVKEEFKDRLGFLLDGDGRAVATSNRWGGFAMAARFSRGAGGFVSAGLSGVVNVVDESGGLTEQLATETLDRYLGPESRVVDRAPRPCLVAMLAVVKARLLLVLFDSSGRLVLKRNIGDARSGDRDDAEDGFEPEEGPEIADDGEEKERLNELPRHVRRARVRLSEDLSTVAVQVSGKLRVYRILPRGRPASKEGRR